MPNVLPTRAPHAGGSSSPVAAVEVVVAAPNSILADASEPRKVTLTGYRR
jgi:hypothetical protein